MQDGEAAMKKGILLFLSALLCFGFAACADRQAAASVPESSSRPAQPDTQSGSAASEAASADSQTAESSADNAEAGGKKAKLTINGREFAVTLYDTPAANALYELLPLELTFADFNGIEKIAYIEDELPTAGEPAAFDPGVGDLCLYAPWGNLSLFYKDFRNSNGLVSLGRLDAGIEVIGGIQEDFSAVLEGRSPPIPPDRTGGPFCAFYKALSRQAEGPVNARKC